jgi:hypothetical protein
MPVQHAHQPIVDSEDRALTFREWCSLVDPNDRVLTFPEWCSLNRFSEDTGRRLIEQGAVEVIELSARRIGITVGADKRFKAARTRVRGA